MVTVFQLSENASEGINYIAYGIVSFEAQNTTKNTWDIIMKEKDDVKGEMTTRISFNLAEENVMYITDGTYTVANGGILVNTNTNNSYSTYRKDNSSDCADIFDANIEVKNNLEAQTSLIKGTFSVGNNVISFEYNGTVHGFMYEEIGEEGITKWSTFKISYMSGDTFFLEAKSTNGVELGLYIHEFGVTSATAGTSPSPGTYPVSDWQKPTVSNYIEKTYSWDGINGKDLKSGELVIESGDRGTTIVTFDFIDETDTRWKGSYKGLLK